MNKGLLEPEDLVVVDPDGRHLEGSRKASSEVLMHLLFYRVRRDVQAVCHAHLATATGFAATGRALDKALLPEVVVGLGQVPLVRYATPGTPELSAAIEPYVEHYDALLLANHGAVTCGPNLLTAFYRMETVEHAARITLAAENAGTLKLFSSREIAKLMATRARYGVQSPPGNGAELPATSDEGKNVTEKITLKRDELDALIEDAVCKDRARR
jgi:L-fuculose-phosphate aldolase